MTRKSYAITLATSMAVVSAGFILLTPVIAVGGWLTDDWAPGFFRFFAIWGLGSVGFLAVSLAILRIVKSRRNDQGPPYRSETGQ